jgi:hypothetical protein
MGLRIQDLEQQIPLFQIYPDPSNKNVIVQQPYKSYSYPLSQEDSVISEIQSDEEQVVEIEEPGDDIAPKKEDVESVHEILEEEPDEEEEVIELPEFDTSYYELNRLFIENGNAIAKWYQDKAQSSISTPGKHTHGSMMKNAVWKHHFNGVTQTLCPVCSTNSISFDNYSLGHIHPESKNGPNIITNLIPICPTCNTLMGTQHLYYYAWNVHKKILWSANTF